MASKSKKRRRVLGASCILAALIIAGSSFAWFTSKDEVTNRLAASADYNVSIIENFAPPKQFVPGQTVMKEEAVVNTGAIDAFVKQTITGNLQVTVEVPTTVNPTGTGVDKSDYVTLTEKEFGTLEAGSTLAWMPTGENGDKVNKLGVMIGMGIDGPDDDNHGFVPAAEGLYVFRRAVHKDAQDDGSGSFDDVSYDYVGYYYVPGGAGEEGTYYKLYKIKVDDANIYTEADDTDPNGRGYINYGVLKKEPAYSFSKLVTTTANKVAMFYEDVTDEEAAEENAKRLKVVFNGQNTIDSTITSGLPTDSQIYTAYHDYLDFQNGRTNYVAPSTAFPTDLTATSFTKEMADNLADTDNATAYDTLGDEDKAKVNAYLAANGNYSAYTNWANPAVTDTNNTGLTDYDIYNKDTTGDNNPGDGAPASTLANFGYDRLSALKTGTAAARTAAEAELFDVGDTKGTQTLARESRQTINTGRNAQAELQYLKEEVVKEIGTADPAYDVTAATTPNTGLYLRRTDDASDDTKAADFEWSALQLYNPASPATTPYIMDVADTATLDDLKAWFVTTGTGDTMTFKERSEAGDNDYTLTVDTMKQPRFADPEQTTNDATNGTPTTRSFGDKILFTSDTIEGNTAPYNDSTVDDGSTLKAEWDELLKQTQRKALNLIKQRLLESVIANGTPAQTDAGRSIEECKAYLNFLKEQYEDIKTDYNTAKGEYEDAANDVADMLKLMNARQKEVDAANHEYDGYFNGAAVGSDNEAYTAVSSYDQSNAYKVQYGNNDSVKENALQAQLENIFGVAKKDTTTKLMDGETVVYDYSATDNCKHTSSHKATELTTYGYDSTMTAITKNLTTNDTDLETGTGVTTWKTLSTENPTIVEAEKTAIQNAPFYKDYITGKMKDFREKQAKAKYDTYQGLIDAAALYDAEKSSATNDVVLYVNLVNIATVASDPAVATAADKWQYMGTADDTHSATDFVFGYTGILETGEVSSLLIKSVEFASDTKQEAFKDLKFDINVEAESAQVIYNGTRISADAAKSSITEIEPTEDEYANSDATVTWKEDGKPAARPTPDDYDPFPKDVNVTPHTYTVEDKTNVSTPVEIADMVLDGVTYKYKLVADGETYYGTSKDNNAEYYKLNEAGTAIVAGSKIVLKVDQ